MSQKTQDLAARSGLSIQALQERKSHSKLGNPYPNQAELMDMLKVAATVPDHGCLKPYRFVVVGPAQKNDLVQAFQASIQSARETVSEHVLDKVGAKALAAPVQIYLIYSPILEHRIPEWEQAATAACTGYAITLAAEALGYSAVWKSFAYSDEPAFRQVLNLAEHEKNLGWINLGTSTEPKPERVEIDLSDKIELRL